MTVMPAITVIIIIPPIPVTDVIQITITERRIRLMDN
jgi:hypothetical protein